jgi:hypothetical protein
VVRYRDQNGGDHQKIEESCSRAWLFGYGEQVPLIRDALELVASAIVELDSRTDDQILHGARDEHLSPTATRQTHGGTRR